MTNGQLNWSFSDGTVFRPIEKDAAVWPRQFTGNGLCTHQSCFCAQAPMEVAAVDDPLTRIAGPFSTHPPAVNSARSWLSKQKQELDKK